MPDSTPTRRSPRRRSGDATAGAQPLPARVGRHVVEGELGRGGMGLVLRARDTRLDRVVALKALPAELATVPHARERFELEARLLAALEHPHVAAIYGIEEEAGRLYLVLQHVEGETLAVRLARGPLSLAETLDVARQVASGLDAAHRRGIVHCDLKPSNVMITPEGVVKLVDFGVATRWRVDDGAAEAPREIAGTPAYMSPEQARGDVLDPRTDVWSFGCVLAECLGGVAPFTTAPWDEPELEPAPPDLSRLPEDTPGAVRDLILRCLARDREQRPASMDRIRAELEAAAASPAAPATAETPALPRWLNAFVGRERELAEVGALLEGSRLLTLTGTAGCGKTRLAAEAAARAAARFPDGAWFAALAPLADAQLVVPCVASLLGVRESAQRPFRVALADELRARSALLILDNCEHVLDEASRLASELLQECPRLTILCTSREALGVPGETAWRVPSLEHPRARRDAPLAELARFDGIRFLAERARDANPAFALDEDTAPVLAAIVERLDGIPLALELAAARMRLLTPQQVLDRLADRFRLLTGGSRTALERHQTLRAALDWSYNLLSDDEKRCLRELSVFAGGFRLEEAAATCTGDEFEVLDLVTALVDKSLVQAESGARRTPRYRLLESVRQLAAMKLDESGEAAAARDRHAACFLDLARRFDRARRGAASRDWLRQAEPEHENFRAALEWWLAGDHSASSGLGMALSLTNFWDALGHWSEGRDWLRRALDRSGAARDTEAWAGAVTGIGRMSWWLGDLDTARETSAAALDAWRALGNATEVTAALTQLAMCEHSAGRFASARALYAEVAEAGLAAGAPDVRCNALLNLCTLVRDAGELDESERLGREGLSIAKEHRLESHEARAHVMLGTLARDRGDLATAWELTQRGLRIHEERHERRHVASALADLGHVASLRGDTAVARDLYARSAAACREMGDRRGAALALANSGALSLAAGDVAEGSSALRESLGLARANQNRPLQASILGALTRAVAREGRHGLAARWLGAVGAAREEMGRRLAGAELAELEQALAELRAALGDEAFDAAWADGAAAGLTACVAEALEGGSGSP